MSKSKKAKPSKSTIFIVDDHPIMRDGLKKLINNEPDLIVCGEAGDSKKALAGIALNGPDIVLVDLSLEGTSGLDLIKTLRTQHPSLLILAVTMHDEGVYAERVLRSGAKGYIMKQVATDTILTAIRQVIKGEIFVSDEIRKKMMTRMVDSKKSRTTISPIDALSSREWEVFQLIGKGRGTRQIAQELSLSVKTIETNRARIKEKLKLKDAMQLVHYAVQWVENPRIR